MKTIFYFILGISLIVLTSSTTVSIMTVKPEMPKQFIVESFNNELNPKKQEDYIREMMKKGWILKSQSLAGHQYTLSGIVVMEKY